MLHQIAEKPSLLNAVLPLFPKENLAELFSLQDGLGRTVLHMVENDPDTLKLLVESLPEEDRARVLDIKNKKNVAVSYELTASFRGLFKLPKDSQSDKDELESEKRTKP